MATARRVLMLLENCPYLRDTRVLQEAQALTAAGFGVAVITPALPGQSWHTVVDDIDVYSYPMPTGHGLLGYMFEYSYALAASLALALLVWLTRGFDVIHAHNPPDAFVLIGCLFRLVGKRFVFDHHDLAPELYMVRFGRSERPWVRHLLLGLEKLSCRCAQLVIVANESHKQILMARAAVPTERIIVVRNGPDLPLLQRFMPDGPSVRNGKLSIGYIGEMAEQDGIDYLLRALALVKHEFGRPDFTCTLIGDGEALFALRQLTAVLGLQEQVEFTGWLTPDAFVPLLASTDICVDPDPSNGYNDYCTMIKIMEYMALGKPVVAFDLPEHRYSAGDAALYASANDERELAHALVALFDDPLRRAEMGKLGRQRVESQLAWRFSADRLVAAYGKLCEAVGQDVLQSAA